ncbi:MAG: type II secretion system GspH family protein [Candidatus Cloacimonetes bacterium]|nr:type II secretion system GspH family protein [Candidatus Cloacimonadota bacterium]MDY0172518.1 type II secretion system protein [Candidatus Cloacimonadaceae bacterium]
MTLKRNDGLSLIELIAVLAMSTILILISAVGVSVFYKRYKITSDFIALQTEAMNCLQTIRNGYGFNRGEEFYGVANAKELEIIGTVWGVGTGVRITPPSSKPQQRSDWVSFYLEDGVIRMDYMYNGIGLNSPKYIFPAREDRDKIQVTRFVVSDGNSQGDILSLDTFQPKDLPILLRVELDARVVIRKGVRPAPDEYKTISYSTYMVKK